MSAHGLSSGAVTPHRFTPVGLVARAVFKLSKAIGDEAPPLPARCARLDPAIGRQIADIYMAAPTWDSKAIDAYVALRRETVEQFGFLTGELSRGGLGITVEIVDYDPYQDGLSVAQDLSRRRLKVYSTKASGNPHPFLADSENDMLRAVHDTFGHAASGCGFDTDGEETAWLVHRQLYTPLARRALTTEMRGQNCARIFHFGGRQFPEQKMILLPQVFSDPSRLTKH